MVFKDQISQVVFLTISGVKLRQTPLKFLSYSLDFLTEFAFFQSFFPKIFGSVWVGQKVTLSD